MNIADVPFSRDYTGATDADIVSFTSVTGAPLDPLHESLLRRGAGYLQSTHHISGLDSLGLVQAFVGTDATLADSTRLSALLSLSGEYWPSWFAPLATDPFGNYYGISAREEDRGAVWFWDHEAGDEEEPQSALTVIVSPSMADFLEHLTEYEV